MKKKFFIVSFFIFIVPNICLSYSNDPKQFITEIVNEAKQILDVKDVISSILLVEDLRIQKD